MAVTGEQVHKMLEEIIDKVLSEWDLRIGRLWENQKNIQAENRELRSRVDRLERIIEKIGKASLQERP